MRERAQTVAALVDKASTVLATAAGVDSAAAVATETLNLLRVRLARYFPVASAAGMVHSALR